SCTLRVGYSAPDMHGRAPVSFFVKARGHGVAGHDRRGLRDHPRQNRPAPLQHRLAATATLTIVECRTGWAGLALCYEARRSAWKGRSPGSIRNVVDGSPVADAS